MRTIKELELAALDLRWDKRRQLLQEALKKAALELLEHMNGAAGFSFPLDASERLWVTVGPKPDEKET